MNLSVGKEKDGEGGLFAFAVKKGMSVNVKNTKESADVNSNADVEKKDVDMSMRIAIGNPQIISLTQGL